MKSATAEPTTEHKEYYHTLRRYDGGVRRGLDPLEPFLEHVRAYFAGKRTVPVSRISSANGAPAVTFTFSNELLRQFLQDRKALEKPYEVAIKYGFGGHSRGGRNGIFYQRKEDKKMWDATDKLVPDHESEIYDDLDISEEGLDGLRKVRIVWHNKSGQRVVGVYNTENSRMIFLDFASY